MKPIENFIDNEATKKDFLALPKLTEKNQIEGQVTSIVIVPSRKKHDPGFAIMHIVPCFDCKPYGIIKNTCDFIGINGIIPVLNSDAWSIDCLWKSGFLRLFTSDPRKALELDGYGHSSFSIKQKTR